MVVLFEVADDLQEGLLNRVQLCHMQWLAQCLQHVGSLLCSGRIRRIRFSLRQHQSAEAGQHLILRSDTGRKHIVLVGCQQACQFAEPWMFQQLADDCRIDPMGVQFPGSLYRQSQLADIVMFAIRYVGDAQQEIGGHLEVLGYFLQAAVGQLVRLTAHEAAEGAFVDANGKRQLRLLQIVCAAQVADSVPDVAGKPVFHAYTSSS